MKKINYFYVALLSIILVVPSCSKDDEVSPSNNEGGKVVVDSTYSSLTATFTSLSSQIGSDKYLFKVNDSTIVVKTYFEKTSENLVIEKCVIFDPYIDKYNANNEIVYAARSARKIIVHYDIFYKSGKMIKDTIIDCTFLTADALNNREYRTTDFINSKTGSYPYAKFLQFTYPDGTYSFFY